MTIPATPTAIDAAWLTSALQSSGALVGAAVTGVEVVDIGEGTGIFGDIARLHLTYDQPVDAPATVVAKLPCVEPENLAVAQALGIYVREVAFFADVAPATLLRVPACLYSELSDDGRFVLILEDMGVGYEVGDQVVGATLDQARAAIAALADLHIRWWESAELDALDWLPVPDAPQYMAAVPDIYRGGLPVLIDQWSDRVPAEAIAIAKRLEPVFEDLMRTMAGAPSTFAHADTRLDNIFFGPTGDDGLPSVAFIDFQLSLRARGVTDLAYLLGTSVPREIAAANWEQVLREWHTKITDAGIVYPWDTAVRHYKECALYYLVGAMSLIASFDTGNERGEAMAEAYVTRICNHIVDIDAGEVLG